MKRYLIDTNIAIFYMKGKFGLGRKFEEQPDDTLFISEVTLAELKFGVAYSQQQQKNGAALDDFLANVEVIPISNSLDLYALEKARLRKAGTPIGDFDLLIGVTSIVNDLVMVTNNTNHFKPINGIVLEDWTK